MSAPAAQSSGPPPSDAPANRLLPEDRSTRRWISRRLEQLDPVQDYAEIIKLTSIFYMSDFIMDWAFTTSLPRFTLGFSGTAIGRGGDGKLFTDIDRRFEDTAAHGVVWSEYGPESPQAKRSLDIVNALHAKWQKAYPAEFNDLDLWTYVIAWQVCGVAILFGESLGFPPPSEKEKIARVIYGKKLAERFIYVDGRPLSQVMPALDTYEDWVTYVREYESRPFAYNQETTDCLNQVLDGFEKRTALPGFFTRALVTSFWHDGMFRYTGIKPPGRFMRWAAQTYMKIVMINAGIRGDPKESYPEKLRRKAAETGGPLNPILKATQGSPEATAGRCPMGFGN